jgi:peptidoglycan/xylan/chitin deacetylase (PgdA/CDA1 family)
MNRSRKDRLALAMNRLGILRLLESTPSRSQLIVVNYHRIGDACRTHFDPGVFTTDADGLDEQIAALKRRYAFVTPSDALDVIEGRYRPRETLLLVTFDDGYRDNLANGLPVLARHGLSAIFFVVSSYADGGVVPWWDQIAWLARRIAPGRLEVDYPRRLTFDFSEGRFEAGLRDVLSVYKSLETTDTERFVAALEAAAGFRRADIRARLFMDWDDVRTMHRAGMEIGVHTHSHRILAKLASAEQRTELGTCKMAIERETGVQPRFAAYPVGTEETFSEATKAAAAEVGLRAAFSFYGGTNRHGRIDPFDVKRVAFNPYTPIARARLSTATMASTASRWF